MVCRRTAFGCESGTLACKCLPACAAEHALHRVQLRKLLQLRLACHSVHNRPSTRIHDCMQACVQLPLSLGAEDSSKAADLRDCFAPAVAHSDTFWHGCFDRCYLQCRLTSCMFQSAVLHMLVHYTWYSCMHAVCVSHFQKV